MPETLTNPAFTFDRSVHEYRLEGQRLLSVTEVLRKAGFIDETYFNEEARDRGLKVHKAIHYMLDGDLDADSLDSRLNEYVKAARAFIVDQDIEVIEHEVPRYHSLYRYAGTLDALVLWKGKQTLIDWKTGIAPKWASLQLAGYEELLPDSGGYQSFRKRVVIELKEDGKWNPVFFDDCEDKPYFLAALSTVRKLEEFKCLKQPS